MSLTLKLNGKRAERQRSNGSLGLDIRGGSKPRPDELKNSTPPFEIQLIGNQ